MNHSYENNHSFTNSYLNKKRFKDSNDMDNKHHYIYDKNEKYDKDKIYKNMNNYHHKPFRQNYFHNPNYINNSYSNKKSKNYYYSGYSNHFSEKKKSKKSFNIYLDEEVRNLSNCEIVSPKLLSLKENVEENSLKSISNSTNCNSIYKSDNQFNNEESQKFVSYIVEKSQFFHPKNINRNKEDITNKQNVFSSLSSKPNKKEEFGCSDNYEYKNKEKDELSEIIELPNIFKKISNYESFNRSLIRIEENTLDNIIIYPESLLEFNKNIYPEKSNVSKYNFINNNNIAVNILSIKSCYLLAKIPNWRLVSKFVPISSLKSEKFQKNLKMIEKETDDKLGEKNGEISVEKKTHIVYLEKYENFVEDCLEKNRNKKKEINKDIFNMKSIISQYQYDDLIIKNKIRQSKYEINSLNIKNEELGKVLDGNKYIISI